MRDESTRVIDGTSYQYTQLDTTSSLLQLTELRDAFGESLGHLIGFAKIPSGGSILDADLNSSALAEAMAAFSKAMPGPKFVEFMQRAIKNARLDGGAMIVFNDHFRGRLMHLFKVAMFCLESEYADFLDGKGLIGSMLEWLENQGVLERIDSKNQMLNGQSGQLSSAN